MAYNTKYKHLVVSGCSFTANDHHESISWGNMLGDLLGIQVHNLAVPSGSNEHISRSIMYYLSKNKMSPADTLVIAMWSGIDRTSLIVSKEKYIQEPQHPTYNYNNFSEYYLIGGNMFGQTHELCKAYKELLDDETYVLLSWFNMQNLSNYLNINKFEHRFTMLSNINWDLQNGWKPDACRRSSKSNFVKTLKTLEVSVDFSQWILTGARKSLHEVSIYNDLQLECGHPSAEGHAKWMLDYLVPALIDERIITHEL
jgi:hypothetical protein